MKWQEPIVLLQVVVEVVKDDIQEAGMAIHDVVDLLEDHEVVDDPTDERLDHMVDHLVSQLADRDTKLDLGDDRLHALIVNLAVKVEQDLVV